VSDEQHEALERLERRVEVLEQMMRRLLTAPAAPDAPALRPTQPISPSPSPPPRPSPPRLPETPPPRQGPPARDLEQWFGQRGLLVVGVVALLAAMGFFLKYAFDRGWVPPAARSLLAVAAGVGVAAWGEQRIGQGMRRYGAAMIGAGGGLVYLGLWAAAGPYALLDRRVGVLLLAASTVAVTLLALRHEIEGLAIWALAGAYLAPILLPPPTPNPDAFLGYLEIIGLGTGILAYTMTWRRTFDLALAGYLLLAAAGAGTALESALGCWFLAAGALLTVHVTRRRGWPEARLGILLLAWVVLGVSLAAVRAPEPKIWLALGAAAVVAGLLWWQQMERDPFAGATPGDTGAAVERILFLVNPFAFLLLARAAGPKLVEHAPWAFPGLLAAIYLVAGWLRRAAPLFIMGFALAALALGLAAEQTATTDVVGWTGLAVAALAAERWAHRPGGRVAALGLAMLAFVWLFGVAGSSRESGAAVFTDAWALALYTYIAGSGLCARWWQAPANPAAWEARGGEVFWALCGGAVFAGGSVQFYQYFGRMTELAGNLALSVWWLSYAGALVSLGFRLDRKAVRSAGLAVAAGAGLKIVLYDLSTLEALYRIASFFALALIALAVAYAYNRKGGATSSRNV